MLRILSRRTAPRIAQYLCLFRELRSHSPKHGKRCSQVRQFKPLMAPVFTCFKDDYSLELRNVNCYAAWLKNQGIDAVLVNSVSGEGPALGYKERKDNAEVWWEAAERHGLFYLLNVGGAPVGDVLRLTEHAKCMGVHAITALPDLFYKPATHLELLGYCRLIVARCCPIPFLYYHIPDYTGVNFDMSLFCSQAKKTLPNFGGILYHSTDLYAGLQCLKRGRIVYLSISPLLAGAMFLGFELVDCAFINGRPKLIREIYDAMINNDFLVAKKKQLQLNRVVQTVIQGGTGATEVEKLKSWFNEEMQKKGGAGFSAGPTRRQMLNF